MVSAEYLDRIGFATIRREPGDTSDKAMDELLEEYIKQAREDMVQKGVKKEIANDEENPCTKGCIQSFVRWKMSFDNRDSVPNLEEYRIQLDELRKNT